MTPTRGTYEVEMNLKFSRLFTLYHRYFSFGIE